MASSPLLSLPEELLAAIASFVAVDCLLPFALTCPETHQHVKERLEKNRKYHAKYRIQHDRSPLTVPTLLRVAINSDAAWHIRSFESWGPRPGFSKWKTWDEFQQYESHSEDYSQLSKDFFPVEERDQFRVLLEQQLNMGAVASKLWMGRIEEGWDEPLKGLLFAFLPRLQALNFIAYDSWQSDEFQYHHPLQFLCNAIDCFTDPMRRKLDTKLWPPGFQSLRTVSICSSTSLRHPHDAFYAPPSAVAPLFTLPNIETLNFTLLGYSDDPTPYIDLPPRSSTVKNLNFSCCDMTLHVWVKFVQAPIQLRSFLSASSILTDDGDEELIRALARNHGEHLEGLSLQKYDGHVANIRNVFPRLKSLDALDISDLLRHTLKEDKIVFREPHQLGIAESSSLGLHDLVQLAELRELLPVSLERLGLRWPRNPGYPVVNEVVRAVADLVEDERFSSLGEVCLANMFPYCPGAEKKIQTNDLDKGALRRIFARGTETHTTEDGNQKMSWSEHARLHADGNNGLIDIETDPRPPEERD